MKPGIPWSIKGIESDAREAAKAAAARSGMTLGQWFNHMIQEGASLPLEASESGKKSGRKHKSKKKKHKKTEQSSVEIADRLSKLSEQDQATAVNRFVDYENESVAGRAIEAMIDRIERGEANTRESFKAVNTRLEAIDDKLVAPTENSVGQSQEFQSLETALRNIVDHIESSEKRNRDALGNMQERMSDMTQRLENSQDSAIGGNAPAIAALDARVAELALQHEQSSSSNQDENRSYLEERLANIGEQIDAVRHSTDAMTRRAEQSAADVARKEANEVEQRVANLIGEARTLMVKSAPSNATLGSIRGDIESLNQRFDDIKAESASDQEVQSLKLAVEQLSAGSEGHQTQVLEQHLEELTQRLNETPTADHMAPQFAELEQRISGLDQQLTTTMGSQGDSETFAALESQISAVADRISATEEKLGTLTTIEQSISKLYSAVEENKTQTHQIAEGAVNELMQKGVTSADETGPSPELVALQDGLAAVKQSSRAAEQHSQETLEAVHETLEQIIAKLAAMEAVDIDQSAAQTTIVHPDQLPAEQTVQTDDTGWQDAIQSHLQEDAANTQSEILVDQNLTEVNEGADVSPAFNPGPLPEMPQEPEIPAPPAATELPEAYVPPQSTETPATAADDFLSQDPDPAPLDYIAQARQASQTASSPVKGGGFLADKLMLGKKDDDGSLGSQKSKSLFSLPFLAKKKVEADNDEPALEKPQDKEQQGSRKRLLLAGLVLLIAAGSFAYNKFNNDNAAAPTPTASAPAKVVPAKAPVKKSPLKEQPDQVISQTSATKNLVKKVSLSLPQTNPPKMSGRKLTAAQTGMPISAALESGNTDPDATSSAPTVPVSTSALSAAPSKSHGATPSAEVQKEAKTSPPKAEETASAENASLLPASIGTLELRKAATSGDSSAQFVVASRYVEGKQVHADFTQAAAWYQKAASAGLAPAQYRLGTLFERGNGVPKDLNAARLWYERAAEKGNVKAMHNLAVIYANPKSGQTDYAKAKKWFEKASSHGLKDSQFNLAVIHERGLVGKPSRKEAYYWYSIAALRGDRDAKLKAHSLKNYLSATALKSADNRRDAWKPKGALKSGNFVAIKDPKWQVAGSKKVKPQLGSKPQLSGPKLVKQTQTLLTKLGFDVGGADGVMGSRTANAVRLFQMRNGLRVNGMVTNDLLQQLQARS